MSRRELTSARYVVGSVCLTLLCILLAAVLFVGLRTLSVRTGSQHIEATQTPGGENKAAEAARIHLARQINVDVALLSVDSVERVWWPDSCLGLPGPSELCEPVRTPGFHIVLAAGEYRFVYRTDITGENIRLEELAATIR